MGDKTKIAWTQATWNPLRGCTKVSAGCANCYAENMAARFWGPGQPYEGLTVSTPNGAKWNGKVKLVHDKLDQPLRWKRPRMVFVNSMSDLFHHEVPFLYISAVFGVMAASPHHTFQVLTKRPERMLEWFERTGRMDTHGGAPVDGPAESAVCCAVDFGRVAMTDRAFGIGAEASWPLPNVWLGVSAENQATADERIPLLLQCPADVHWVSLEPLLGPVDLADAEAWDDGVSVTAGPGEGGGFIRRSGLDWVVVGGESGPKARPCAIGWIGSIVEQCSDAGVPCFVKQLGADPYEVSNGDSIAWTVANVRSHLCLKHRSGADMNEWPAELRVREFP